MKKLLLLSVILASLLLVPVISLAQTEDLGTTAAGAGIGIVCLILWIIYICSGYASSFDFLDIYAG